MKGRKNLECIWRNVECADNEYMNIFIHIHTISVCVAKNKYMNFVVLCVCVEGWQDGDINCKRKLTKSWSIEHFVNRWVIKVLPNYLLPVYMKEELLILSLVLCMVATWVHFLALVSFRNSCSFNIWNINLHISTQLRREHFWLMSWINWRMKGLRGRIRLVPYPKVNLSLPEDQLLCQKSACL